MEIILSHRYLDFDALASMAAAQILHPEALLIVDGDSGSGVQNFLALAKEHLTFSRLKEIDAGQVTRIILVDAHNLNRCLSDPAKIKLLQKAELEIYDHHPYPEPGSSLRKINTAVIGGIPEKAGACTTLLIEKIRSKGLKLSSFEATLMTLGIYEDTGSLLFENTTVRDLEAAAFLLGQGAQLAVVAAYLRRPLSADQMELFYQLLNNGMPEKYEGTNVYLSYAEREGYLDGLAVLVHRIAEIENADAWFIAVRMGNKVYIVGRSNGKGPAVNKVLAALGGGGHDKAASAVMKNTDVYAVLAKLREELRQSCAQIIPVREIMSYPVKTVSPETTIAEASAMLLRYGHTGVPVLDNNRLAGIISRRDVDKALRHGLEHAPVKGFMTAEVITAGPDLNWEEVQNLMVLHDIGRLPVIESGNLVGIVTRSDVLRQIYNSIVPTAGDLVRKRSIAGKEDSLALIRRLPAERQQILETIKTVASGTGESVYLVGGTVRDLLLNVATSDLDIVVEGDAHDFAGKLGRVLPARKITGHQAFGTASILLAGGSHVDVAGTRREYYDFPGALPRVEESNLKEDLLRRDFTINAIALSLNETSFGEIIDYYGGIRDLQQGEIRFLHNLSFIDDPTRILRAVRFAGRYGFKLAKVSGEAVSTALEAQVFARLSPERFSEELYRIYREPNYQAMGRRLLEYQVFRHWFGDDFLWNYQEDEEDVRQWPLVQRWLVSLKNIAEPEIGKILKRLRLNRQEQKATREYLRIRNGLEQCKGDLAKMDKLFAGASAVQQNVFLCHNEFAQAVKQYIIALSEMNMGLTSKKLLEMGIQEGPLIGKILGMVRKSWLEGRIKSTEQEEEYLRHLIPTPGPGKEGSL